MKGSINFGVAPFGSISAKLWRSRGDVLPLLQGIGFPIVSGICAENVTALTLKMHSCVLFEFMMYMMYCSVSEHHASSTS
jgi:hypothetical protein